MRNPYFFFMARRFFEQGGGLVFRLLSRFVLRSVPYEVADLDELRRLTAEKKTIFYIVNRASIIEQFLLNVFLCRHHIAPPSHSFGPRTLVFFPLGALLSFFIEWLKGGRPRRYARRVTGLYLPVEDQEFFAHDPGWAGFITKVPARETWVVPVTTLWNKESVDRYRDGGPHWLKPFFGTYNLWSTFRELFLFLLGRRRLALRIGLARELKRERYSPHLYRRFYAILKEEKRNIVGASLRNWLEMRNETLFALESAGADDRAATEQCLDEMATRYSPYFTDGVARLIGRLLFSVFSRIEYRADEIAFLRRLAARRDLTLVFVPSHRSYYDYLIMFHLLYREQVAVPLVVAGDNLAFFPLGPILRRLGAFFIRRRMRDDPRYRTVFRSYLETVVHSGYHIEFFIEGGRTRSGKVRAPRTGVLSMLADIKRHAGRRVYIVPISITYERLREVLSYRREAAGGKEPERKGFLRKFMELIRAGSGPAYVSFGRPIAVPGRFQDEFAAEVAYRIERGGSVSFSGIFAALFATDDAVYAPALPRRIAHLAALLSATGRYRLVPALQHPELHVPRLIERLRDRGQIVETRRREHSYRLAPDAVPEFIYHRNTAAFALAPLFLLLFDADEDQRATACDYLEAVIQGYRVADRVDGLIDPATVEPWVPGMLCRLFLPSFRLLDAVLAFFLERDRRFDTRSAAVRHLGKLFLRRRMLFSTDEIYDVLTYLEQRGVIDTGVICDDAQGARLAADIRAVITAMEREGEQRS